MCIYDCLGSQRVTEPEFDEHTAVVSKGGWGPFLVVMCTSPERFWFVFFICLHLGLSWLQSKILESNDITNKWKTNSVCGMQMDSYERPTDKSEL